MAGVSPHMKPIAARPLSTSEAAVVQALLQRAPLGVTSAAAHVNLAGLRVVGLCECGCDSLFFAGIEAAANQYRIADGLGYTTEHEQIGLILWASGDAPVHLELYNYAEHPARLPNPASVCPFEGATKCRE
jgi:hypothetical protein